MRIFLRALVLGVLVSFAVPRSLQAADAAAPFVLKDRDRVVFLGDTLIERTSPGVRIVLLSPIAHENLGAPWPNPAEHNTQLAAYARVVGEFAAERKTVFVPLYDVLRSRSNLTLTVNGIHQSAPAALGARS